MRMHRRRFLAAAVAAAFVAGGAVAAAGPRVIRIRSRRFKFMPDKVALRKGQPVVFELTAEDVFMGMNIPDFKVRSDIVPGKTMKLAFTPDRAGTFTFVCDVFCGDGHEDMSGTLVVT